MTHPPGPTPPGDGTDPSWSGQPSWGSRPAPPPGHPDPTHPQPPHPGQPPHPQPPHPGPTGAPPQPLSEHDRALLAEQELRKAARERIDERRGLQAHLLAFVLVNAFLVVIWATTDGGFFWPLFPIFGWGIGLAFHVWGYLSPDPTEAQVDAEMERMRRRT
ncbi:2TM domain-containing protein [Thalassiella azotivora]